ncbi:MAG: SpoIIE family protein phosphatase [Treponema sp.]|nr:SpoIIE family protein phosphatase [Treponema sp.]
MIFSNSIKTKSVFTLLLLSISVLILSSCKKEESVSKIDLTKDWTYTIEKNALPDDFKAFDNELLKNLEKLVPNEYGYIWIKKYFEIPADLKDQNLGIYLGRITLADETYINDAYVGGEGYFPDHEFSAWNTARYYTIPKKILKEGQNEIFIKIWVNGEGSIVSNPFISRVAIAEKAAAREEFWNSKINLIYAFAMLVISAYHLMLYFRNKNEKTNLTFALINIFSALYLSVFFYDQLPLAFGEKISFLIFQKIFSNAMPFILAYMVTSFITNFVHAKEHKIIKSFRTALLIIPIVIILFAPNYRILRSMRWTLMMVVPQMIYLLYVLIRAFIRKEKDAFTLLLGFSPLLATFLIDIIVHNILNNYSFPYITSTGWQMVIISLLFILAHRFETSKRQVEYLNKNLESKVEERTRELSESNSKLSNANSQLELTNNQLVEAKRKADRDMRLAANVQNTFFNPNLPHFKNWDLVYYFKPAAGVSGDLYDFFHDGKNLQGLGLFDVSGHGIASGLVTMLAKTVIDRKFKEGTNNTLSKVMSEIDKQIKEEKGDIENYLTGILIRIQENKIEFINAGHPNAFVRTAKNGKCHAIELKDADKKNGIIGMNTLDKDFTTLKFSMQKGDSLVLYTDCLNESSNKDGKAFGEEGIIQAFEDAGIGSAKSKLDYLLSRFYKYTEGTEIKDDLTVIVLQYNP